MLITDKTTEEVKQNLTFHKNLGELKTLFNANNEAFLRNNLNFDRLAREFRRFDAGNVKDLAKTGK